MLRIAVSALAEQALIILTPICCTVDGPRFLKHRGGCGCDSTPRIRFWRASILISRAASFGCCSKDAHFLELRRRVSGHLLCFIDEDEVMSTLAEGHQRPLPRPPSKRLPVQMPTLLFTGSPKRSSRDRGKFRSVHVPGDWIRNVQMGPPARQSKLPRDVPSSSLVRKTATEMPGNGYSLR